MSAQAGVFYFDGRPIDQALVSRIVESIADFGPDGGGEVVLQGLAMAYGAFHVSPEDRFESQPFRSRRGHVLTWDGRLDNREDLLLQLWRQIDTDTTDCALAMAAYERWGEDAFVRLIGDWSLALWDAATGELKLASDYAGNRGLYYWEDDRQLHWSTSLGELVDRVRVREQIEPTFIIGYLTGAIPPEVTPYSNISSVSAAHVITWSANRPRRKSRFWDLSVDAIRYRDPREYEVRLRTVLADAVRSRLRSTCPAWSELSGGLDSSSVVCLADRLVQNLGGHVHAVETVSYVTDTSPESDERTFIAAVEEQRGKKSHYVNAEACADVMDDLGGWVTPLHPSGVALELFRTVRNHGGRVLLSGHPGDLVMGNFPESSAGVAQCFAAIQPLGFLAAAREWSRASQRPIWHVLQEVLTPYLPVSIGTRRSSLRFLQRNGATTDKVMEAAAEVFLLTPPCVQIWWNERLRRAERLGRYGSHWQGTLINGVLEFVDLKRFQSPSELRQVLHTHPFTDRRLAEFVLAVPPDVLNGAGHPRLLMKKALGCVLPPKVLRRFSKGYVDPFKLRKVKGWSPAIAGKLDSLYVVREGYVDRNKLQAKLRAVCDGSCRNLGNIETVLKLERWLQARETTCKAIRQRPSRRLA